jgi:hypothetical protein
MQKIAHALLIHHEDFLKETHEVEERISRGGKRSAKWHMMMKYIEAGHKFTCSKLSV